LQNEYQQMTELGQRAAAIERKLAKTKEESNDLVRKKRELLDRAAKMKEDVDRAALERDVVNGKVQELKGRIDEIMSRVSGIRTKIEEKGSKLDGLRAKLTGDEKEMSRQLSALEWKLVTAGASAKEESAIVTSIAELRRKLAPYEGANKIAQEMRAMRAQAGKLRGELGGMLEEKRALVEEAHRRHESFLKLRDERMNVLKEVAKIREEVAELKARADKEFMDLASANAEMHILQTKMRRARDEQIQESQRQERDAKKRVAQLAAEKLKKGESLTWDEFKILLESEERIDGVPR